ncbi:hypothetical protein ACVILL_003470 [Bradyrhizobium sp. USDA 3364]
MPAFQSDFQSDVSGTGRLTYRSRQPRKTSAEKEQGATGITTVAPYVAGQWGRGNNRLLR